MGARRVIALDVLPHRLILPKRYGATHTINNREVDAQEAIRSITGGELADVVIEAAGEIDTINLAYTLVRQHGDLVYFGIPHAMEMTLQLRRIFPQVCPHQNYLRGDKRSGPGRDSPGAGIHRQRGDRRVPHSDPHILFRSGVGRLRSGVYAG